MFEKKSNWDDMKVCTKWEKNNNHEDAIIEEDVFFFLEKMKETLVKPSRWVHLWAKEPRNNFIPYHVHIQIQTKYEKKKTNDSSRAIVCRLSMKCT